MKNKTNKITNKIWYLGQEWWLRPLIPLNLGGRGRQISEFEASPVYIVSFRAKTITTNKTGNNLEKRAS